MSQPQQERQVELASRPTVESSAVSSQQLQRQEDLEAIQARNNEVDAHPYDPSTWLKYAGLWSTLGYVELSVGAAWKAERLCGTLLERLENGEGRWQLGFARGFWMMAESLAEEHGVERLQSEGAEKEQMATLQGLHATASGILASYLTNDGAYPECQFVPREYFWLDERFRGRSDELLDRINRELQESIPSSMQDACCEVRRDAFGTTPGSQNILGLFATQHIEAGTTIMKDESTTWWCHNPMTDIERMSIANDYDGYFGVLIRQSCMIPSHRKCFEPSYEKLRQLTGSHALHAIVHWQFLLAALADHTPHPLDHHLIARLTPRSGHHDLHAQALRLPLNIAFPNIQLQAHGIDIFADRAWDTDVLLTVSARVRNNSWHDPLHIAVHPLFSLLNHSCEPNVKWWSAYGDVRVLRLKTHRDIQAGEQLFVAYDGFELANGLRRRRLMMRRWLDTDCMCTRCVREEAEGKLEEREEVEDDGDGSPGVKGVWDEGREKVVFREDRVERISRS